jgi:hypothetical protein
MQEALVARRRKLCWLFWFEGASSDLYAWSGMHTITYDGQDYLGVGHLYGASTVRKTDAVQHTEQQFTLNGLDPSVLGGLELSVRGKLAKVWLAAQNSAEQIIDDPILISELVQDTLSFTRSGEDVLSLLLNTFEALPFVGRSSAGKYSHDRQLQRFADDTGLAFASEIGAAGPAVEWREG